jgi:hypothetical protein
VLSEEYSERKLTLIVEGPASTQGQFQVFIHPLGTTVRANGAELVESGEPGGPNATSARQLATVNFPAGEGWKTVTVILTW